MSKDTTQAKAFIEALDRDSTLQAQFAVTSPNSFDGVVDFASAHGFIFTKDDLESALRHSPDSRIAEQLRAYVH
jgi:predicted ribosomally synthesized peptide with nif11-like leader